MSLNVPPQNWQRSDATGRLSDFMAFDKVSGTERIVPSVDRLSQTSALIFRNGPDRLLIKSFGCYTASRLLLSHINAERRI